MASPCSATPRSLEKWTVKGEVLLVGEPPPDIKLGCFYTNCHDFHYASQCRPKCPRACLVSSVASLGTSGGNFSLRIDVSSLAPSAGHYIYLILWDDRNGNDEYDPAEDWRYVIPLYDDAVFQSATDCVCFYDDRTNESLGTARGWNQSIGLDRYVPVQRAECGGARLSNEVAWCAGGAAHGAGIRFAQSVFPHAHPP